MRILLFISVLIFSSCNRDVKNVEIVNQLFEHFNKHEWHKMADMYIETAEFKDPSVGTEIFKMSHDEIVTKYAELHQVFPDIQDDVIAIYPSGKKNIVVEFISSGTSVNGEKFKLPICTILTIENGKITKDYNYYDNFDETD